MDWATSFQAATSRATSGYERLATHWQELLEKISRGELTPSSLQECLPQFLQDEGTDFYRRLSALSFDLFKGMAELQGESSNDFMQGLLGETAIGQLPLPSPPAPPTPPTASDDPSEWTRWYQSVTEYISEQSESSLRRCQVVLEKVADGRLTPASIQEYSRKFTNERAALLSRDAGELQLRFYEGLIQLNQNFAENLFGRLVRNGSASSDGSVESIQAELVGPVGSTVFASLIVENSADRSSEVSCRISEFRSVDRRGSAFSPPVEVIPANFRLAAGASRSISLRLHLVPEMFVPERNYSATLVIRQREQSIVVILNARATSASTEKEESAVLNLAGPLGGLASGSLSLTNTSRGRVKLRCHAGEVRRADGVGPAFAPKIKLSRQVFALAPGAGATLSLSLHLTRKDYEVGPLYIGVVRVSGLGESAREVPLHIVVSEAAAVAPSKPKSRKTLPRKSPPGKGRKRRRS